MKVIVIGGGSSGTTCAFELRKLNKEIEITIIEKSNHLNYSPCAMPYVIANEINKDNIFMFDKEHYEKNNINLILETEVIDINTKNKKVITKDKEFDYDYLVLAIGSSPKKKIKGISNCLCLKNYDDLTNILDNLENKNNVAIIGSGFIGVETAYSLSKLNKKVSVIEYKERVLPTMFDKGISELIQKDMSNKNIEVLLNTNIKEVDSNKVIAESFKKDFDLIINCTGFNPNIELAKKIDLKINQGIIVNSFLQTSDDNVFACGDCVETLNKITNNYSLNMIGSLAVKQAKVIANNFVGNKKEFLPVLSSTISHIGNKNIGSIGITKEMALQEGIKVVSAKFTSKVKSGYYPSDEEITYFIIADLNGKIIGCQIISDSNISGNLNLVSLAMQKNIVIDDLLDLETCYNPVVATIFDPFIVTLEILKKKIDLLKND